MFIVMFIIFIDPEDWGLEVL